MTPILFALAALSAPPQIAADDLSWMAGYWLSCDGGVEVSETWSDPRGGMLLGAVLTLEDGNITFEQPSVAPTGAGEGVGYFARVNGGQAVIFPAKEASGTRVVFENPDHDFPQRVIYERTGDTIHARIEGHMGDREGSMDWTYRKADLNTRCPT